MEKSAYISPSVKIESGAKSALDPNEARTISPYIAEDVSDGASLAVSGVTTIDPERTFLDKILILHGINFFFDAKGVLRGDGRMSRHYYDVHRLMAARVGEKACADDPLIEDCVRHATVFFYRANTGLDVAKRGTFRLRPRKKVLDLLSRDYEAMSTMIIGDVPSFEAY